MVAAAISLSRAGLQLHDRSFAYPSWDSVLGTPGVSPTPVSGAVTPAFARVKTALRGPRGFGVLAIVLILLLPSVTSDPFQLRILTLSWLAAALTVGLSISLGYAGLFNMSQGTFYGIGAYTTAILSSHHLSFELSILVALAFTTVIGLLVGLTSIRVRGDYWSLVSMAFTVATFEVFANWSDVTGGRDGFFGAPQASFLGIQLDSDTRFYYAALGVLLIAILAAYRLTRTFAARAMLAVRYDEAAASMMGINPVYFKLLSMAFSSAIAALAGAFLVAVSPFVHPSSFDFLPSFNITLFAIVGGRTSLIGGAIAAVFLTSIVEEYRALTDYQLIIYGGAVLLAIFFRAGVLSWLLNPVERGARTVLASLQQRF